MRGTQMQPPMLSIGHDTYRTDLRSFVFAFIIQFLGHFWALLLHHS